jgi:transcription elongation factor GreB
MLMATKLLTWAGAFRDRFHTFPGAAPGVPQTMTRYRRPETPGSRYITAAGARALREELDELWRVQRPQVTRAVSEAAAQGDRSENAEYIYGKRQLREIDRRVRFLIKRLEAAEIVNSSGRDTDQVFFGASVKVRSQSAERQVTIVGVDEVDPAHGRVSWMSPIAKALIKAREGDTVTVRAPGGDEKLEILEVRYP